MELVTLLRRHYGYTLIRQTGSHMRLVSNYMGYPGYVSIPRHNPVKVPTLIDILNNIAAYLETDREEVAEQLFGR